MHYQRFIYLTFIACATVVGIAFRSATIAVFAGMGAADVVLLGVFPASTLIGIVAGLVAFFGGLRSRQAVVFTDDVWVELFKTKWPDREETQNSTLIVFVATLVLAGSLALFDLSWATITEHFLYSGG